MTRKIIYMIICCCMIFATLIQSIENVAFNRKNYDIEYTKHNIYEHIDVSREDLLNATDVLLSYMEGKRDNMEVYATIKNQQREVFNDREKKHMLDVNALIHKAISFKMITFVAFFTMLLVSYLRDKREGIVAIAKMLIKAFVIDFIIILVIVGYAAIDFESFWILFHKVLFTNDLWLLDEKTSIMINMFPLEFFRDIVFKIVLRFSIAMIILFGLTVFIQSEGFNRIGNSNN